MNLALQVLEAAKAKGVIIATAESCTGGMVAAAITDIAGSSAVFDRGFVTYSNEAKTDMLGVDPQTVDEFGAVSEQVTQQMAIGAINHSRATVSVAISGIAGPGDSENKPEGRVCFTVLKCGMLPQTETIEFGALGREKVRIAARNHGLKMIFNIIKYG